jgi:hypothetical protein
MNHRRIAEMTGTAIGAAMMLIATGGSALAACPGIVPGTNAEAIQSHDARLACLQRGITSGLDTKRQQMQIDALNSQVDAIQLQRRFDTLPAYEPWTPPN